MSDRPHEQLCQALEADELAREGREALPGLTAAELLREATGRWRRAARTEIGLRPHRDHLIQLAHKHGLDTDTITQAIGQLPDGRQLLAHTTVQHHRPTPHKDREVHAMTTEQNTPIPHTQLHWYRIHVGECPLCGRDKGWRERVPGEKPQDPGQRYVYLPNRETYDWCDV